MKIILTENLKKNKKGSIINVKNGYARNYLIPYKNSIIATKKNIEKFNLEKIVLSKDILNNFNELKDLSLVVGVAAKKNNELYGSFNNKVIIKIFKKLDFKINGNNIGKNMFIKKIGVYKIDIKNKKNEKKTNFYLILSKVN